MRLSVYFYLFLSFPVCVYAQYDSIIAENIFKYEVKDGEVTNNRIVMKQNTFDLNNRLVRQVFYDSTARVDRIKLFYYDNDLLISEETYGSDFAIDSVRRIKYHNTGLITKEGLYKIRDSIPEKILRIAYKYDDGHISSKIVYSKKNKWLIKKIYSESGDRHIEKIVFRKGINPAGVKEKYTESIFRDDLHIQSRVATKCYGKPGRTSIIKFEYDTVNHLLINEKLFDRNDILVKEIIYRNYTNGRLRSKTIRSGSGKYLEHYINEVINRQIEFRKPEMFVISEDN